MSDLGRRAHLAPSRAQLPVSTYFDQKLFEFIDPRFFQNNSGG